MGGRAGDVRRALLTTWEHGGDGAGPVDGRGATAADPVDDLGHYTPPVIRNPLPRRPLLLAKSALIAVLFAV